MAENKPTLEQLREKIDALDSQVHALLNERAKLAQQVAEVKLHDALQNNDSSIRFYRPEREAQVLRKVKDRNQGPLPDNAVAHIFREIMSACLALEKPLTIAYLGPEGTFTHAAAIKHFGHAALTTPVATIDQVFAEVEAGEAMYGVVPVENSTEGMVTHTLDSFLASNLRICGEVELPIHLHLLTNERTSAAAVRRICAHPQALGQARQWLDSHWPQVEREAVSNNAEAARLAAEQDGVAAVAGDFAATEYGLQRLAENIEDYAGNTTRFLVIGHDKVPPSGQDKTSIAVSTHNRPGALFHLLAPFQREGIMLTRIDTRPSRTENWAYVFFIEFEGHRDEPAVQRVLDELAAQAAMLKILGSYPRAVL